MLPENRTYYSHGGGGLDGFFGRRSNENPINTARAFWLTEVKRNPGKFLVDTNRFRTAFGNGAILLHEGGTLQNIIKGKGLETVLLAGIEFSTQELTIIGNFYNYLGKAKGGKGVCMDERVNQSHPCGIHKHCGAAAEIGKGIGGYEGERIEDMAMLFTGELDRKKPKKTPVIKGMESGHESSVIWLDLGGDLRQINPKFLKKMKMNGALPFQIHIPFDSLDGYQIENRLSEEEKARLLNALLKWNVGIATNIILSSHNLFDEQVQKQGLTVAIGRRGSGEHMESRMQMFAQVESYLKELRATKKLKIATINIY